MALRKNKSQVTPRTYVITITTASIFSICLLVLGGLNMFQYDTGGEFGSDIDNEIKIKSWNDKESQAGSKTGSETGSRTGNMHSYVKKKEIYAASRFQAVRKGRRRFSASPRGKMTLPTPTPTPMMMMMMMMMKLVKERDKREVDSSGNTGTNVKKIILGPNEKCKDATGATKQHLDVYPIGNGTCGTKTCYVGATNNYVVVRQCRQVQQREIPDKTHCKIVDDKSDQEFPHCCPYLKCQENAVSLPTIGPSACIDASSALACSIWKKYNRCDDFKRWCRKTCSSCSSSSTYISLSTGGYG